jgi:hypothetical protein
MKTILNGKDSLAEQFAEIDHQKVIAKMKEAKKDETRIPPKVKKLIRKQESMHKLLFLIAS